MDIVSQLSGTFLFEGDLKCWNSRKKHVTNREYFVKKILSPVKSLVFEA